jgi:hypothetical protein
MTGPPSCARRRHRDARPNPRERYVTCGHVLLQVGDRARARNQQGVRGRGADLVGHLFDDRVVGDVGEAWERRSEGKERNPRDALWPAQSQRRFLGAIEHAVCILDAGEAVYRAELADVSASAGQLLTEHPPADALRRWMDRYAEFVAAKRAWPSRCARSSSQAQSSAMRPERASSLQSARPVRWGRGRESAPRRASR